MTTASHVNGTARRLLPAALVAGALALGLPLLAHSAETGAVTVRYSPAALTSETGARNVYAQIRSAARQVCGQPGSRALQDQRATRECRRQAVAKAVAAIGSPTLAAVHTRESSSPRLAGAGDLRSSR
jgi:UrcA family protein